MQQPDKSVAFIMNGIGDSVLAIPTLRALEYVFGGKLKVLTAASRYGDLLEELLSCEVVRVEHRFEVGVGRLFDATEVAHRLGGSCDVFVNLNPWHSPSVSDLLDHLACNLTVGFNHHFDHAIPLDFNKHSSALAFDAALALNSALNMNDYSQSIAFPESVTSYVTKILSDLPPATKVLCVHHDTTPEKRWDLESMRSVVCSFLSNHHEYLCFVVGKERLFENEEAAPVSVIELDGRSLLLAQCLVSRADLFLGVDSCMLHVADICRVPSVALFGPTDPNEFGCIWTKHITLRGARDSVQLDTDRVLNALEELASS